MSTSSISKKKLWLFSAITFIVIPLIILLSIEGFLRVINYGYDTSFLKKCEEPNCNVYRGNPKFSWPYFSKAIPRHPAPLAIPFNKDSKTYRIFVLGGSAAEGFPDVAFSFPRILEVMLEDQYLQVNIEVFNTAMSSNNSYLALEIIKDLVKLEPDLFIVYLGNNEVTGPFGPSTVFNDFSGNLAAIRMSIFVNSTRIGQLLGSITEKFTKKDRIYEIENRDTEEIHNFLRTTYAKKKIPPNDPQLKKVYKHFEKNLTDIVSIAQENKTPLILSTVGSNLKDWAPFASLKDSQTNNKYAQNHFDQGQKYIKQKKYTEAYQELVKARNYDALHFRTDSKLNEVIKKVGQSKDTILIDTEKIFEKNSLYGIPGKELFYEYVHMNYKGNYVLAKELLKTIQSKAPKWLKTKALQSPPLTIKETAQVLGDNGYNRLLTTKYLIDWHQMPPNTNLSNINELIEALQLKEKQLTHYLATGGLQEAKKKLKQALDKRPDDHWIRYYYALILLEENSPKEAISHLQKIHTEIPDFKPACELLISLEKK